MLWFWLRHGQKPTVATIGGALLAAVGLVLVLDLVSGAPGATAMDPVGVAWALVAMLGAASYFVINAHADTGLPPLALAARRPDDGLPGARPARRDGDHAAGRTAPRPRSTPARRWRGGCRWSASAS